MADQLELAAEKAGKGELVAKTVRDIINEIQVKSGCSPFQDVSTEGWFRSWLRNKRSSTAESSQLRYTATIDEFLEFIGKRSLKSIQLLSVDDIIEFRDYLEASGIAAKSVRMALKVLRACLGAAVNQGLRVHNPAMGVELPNGRSLKKRFFSAEQVDLLLDHAPDREWHRLIRLAYYTGARLGDLKDLRRSEIDLVRRILTFTPKKQRRSKEPESLTIPLHPDVIGDLGDLDPTSEYIFPTLSKKSVGGKTGLSLTFRGIIDAAGIPYESCLPKGPRGRRVYSLGFHSLRRTFNSLLANANVPQEIRKKLVGQASDEVNDMYTDFQTQTLRDAVHRLPSVGQPTKLPTD